MTAAQNKPKIDVLAVGELLVDLISHQTTTSLAEARDFHRYQGGSPANLCANLARLGNRSALIACVGNESLGVYLKKRVAEAGVITDYIVTDPVAPTTVILLTRTPGTADFIAYRVADTLIRPDNIPEDLFGRVRIFHTTCFALSRQPAQKTIVDAALRMAQNGAKLSIDCNYAPSIWGDREEARNVVQSYCAGGALVKISLDDVARLFEDEHISEENAIRHFHGWGAELVCLTLGKQGSIVSSQHGSRFESIKGRLIRVADATGAGDAYWSGFLTAWLDGKPAADCAKTGAILAEMKLQKMGPLPVKVDKSVIYAELEKYD